MRKQRALNTNNLAIIGIVDDFYDVYLKISDSYSHHENSFRDLFGNKKILWPTTLDSLTLKSVKQLCDPLFQKYAYIFLPGFEKIYTNVSCYQDFTFFNVYPTNKLQTLEVKVKSFDDFLAELHLVATRALLRWLRRDNPQYSLLRLSEEIDTHIAAFAKTQEHIRLLNEKNAISTTDSTLYLFDSLMNIACRKNNHPIESAIFVANFATKAGQIALPVHFCNRCKKHFIGTKTLSLFEKNYGKLIIERRKASTESPSFEGFHVESKLHQYGYNVVDGNLSDFERQHLLKYLLERGHLSYFEICSTIEHNIHLFQNSNRHQLAISKWKKDLKYIGNLVLEQNNQ